jgi:hypothetical protein
MLRIASILVLAIGLSVAITFAQQSSTTGLYKVLKSARAGGEGNWGYIYADGARGDAATRARVNGAHAAQHLQSRHARTRR